MATFSQIVEDIFWWKKNFQSFYYFHVVALLFMSARLILGHFLPIFYGISSKLQEIGNFSLKIVIFCHFEYFSTFLVQNSVRGTTFNFRQIFVLFHEYTLNVTSYTSDHIRSYHIISYHIISYHIISYHIISYHIISYHIISYHIISYHIISYHIISYHIISYHIISYHIISYHIISYHIISYHIISYIISYHITLYQLMVIFRTEI